MKTPILAALALSGCALGSNWHLVDEGYSIQPRDDGFAVEVHVNQLKQIGGEVHSAEFRRFVAERVKQHGVCKGGGWAFLNCTEDGSCVQHTNRSVTVYGYCTAP